MSTVAVDNRGVKDEWAVAQTVEKSLPGFVIPLRLDKCDFSLLPIGIHRKNVIDFANGWHAGLASLLDTLIYQDKELMLAARAASLAKEWARNESAYKPLSTEFIGALKTKIAERFDRFAILSVWNHEDTSKCVFSVEPHGTKGDKVPAAKGRTMMSRMGHKAARQALYMPGVVAMKHNPTIKAMRERLSATGMAKKAIVGALMRKLVHQIFAIVKSGKPFDPFMSLPRLDIQDRI